VTGEPRDPVGPGPRLRGVCITSYAARPGRAGKQAPWPPTRDPTPPAESPGVPAKGFALCEEPGRAPGPKPRARARPRTHISPKGLPVDNR
jgi:hypothetical protein